MLKKIILFLFFNFLALGLGGLFTNQGVTSDWYLTVNKAPWTPPGWVFGAAWTTIMICFSIYMAYALEFAQNKRKLLLLFAFQWLLNVVWNPIFFTYHKAGLGLFVISALTVLVFYFLINYWKTLRGKSILILPYCIWLLIATSLNAYILLYN